jgi:ABC-type Fe3+/spermidine/putrescine transport system ATPase subunit
MGTKPDSPHAPAAGVEVRELTVRYGATVAVDRVSLAVKPGELFFLLGPSGCGKTSLLRAIGGLEPAATGQVLIDGRDVTKLAAHRRGTPMVFQGYALWPHMTLLENTAYGLEARGVARAKAREKAQRCLRLVGLAERAGARPAELSGGQQQRVALARALACDPGAVLFDEPLSNLDAKLRRDMRTELVRLHREAGFTAVYVTHDQEEALSMAQRVALMRDGRLVEIGEPRAMYARPATRFGADFLGEAGWLQARPVGAPQGGRVLVTTAVGGLSLPAPASSAPLYVLGFRPERFRPGGGPEGALRLDGTVRTVSFLGGNERVELELAGGKTVLLRPEAAELRPGQKLSGHVRAEDLWLFPA